MSETIRESGMNFIADNAFHIDTYKTTVGYNDIKSVEYVRSIGNKLLFVEAKSSFPNPDNQTPNPDKRNKTGSMLFNEEIADICEKFSHSLNLYSAVAIGVRRSRFPSEYKPADNVSLQFILVIRDHKEDWCDNIEKALTNRIRKSICMSKIWKPDVIVISDKAAMERKIIVN